MKLGLNILLWSLLLLMPLIKLWLWTSRAAVPAGSKSERVESSFRPSVSERRNLG